MPARKAGMPNTCRAKYLPGQILAGLGRGLWPAPGALSRLHHQFELGPLLVLRQDVAAGHAGKAALRRQPELLDGKNAGGRFDAAQQVVLPFELPGFWRRRGRARPSYAWAESAMAGSRRHGRCHTPIGSYRQAPPRRASPPPARSRPPPSNGRGSFRGKGGGRAACGSVDRRRYVAAGKCRSRAGPPDRHPAPWLAGTRPGRTAWRSEPRRIA